MLARTGKLSEARGHFEDILSSNLTKWGEDHPITLESRHNLATALAMLGEHERVLELDLKILESRRRRLGNEHPSTITTLHSIGEGLVQMERFEEALAMAEQPEVAGLVSMESASCSCT